LFVRYRVTLFKSEEGWAVRCPDLPDCRALGATREEALVNIKDAIRLWIEVEAQGNGLRRIEHAEVAI
jgi:predicted RNase H-like HicB family nuclease